jgi:hypothetical protein
MKKRLTKEEVESLKYISKLDIIYALDDFETLDEARENLETAIREYEVVYYSNAIEFLSEEDPSLNESLGLADELGYTLDQLNSELLATILIQEKMMREIEDVIAMLDN